MNCYNVERLLATRRDLDPGQARAVQTHLLGCDRCAAAWQREQRTSQILQSLPMSQAQLSPQVAVNIRTRLNRPLRRWRHQFATATVVALCCLVFLGAVAAQSYPQVLQGAAARLGLPFAAKQERLYVVGYELNAPETSQRLAVFNPTMDEQLLTVAGVDDIVVSPDSARVYGGTRDHLLALDAITLREVWRIPYTNRAGVYAIDDFPPTLAVSPDGRWLYVLSFDPHVSVPKGEDVQRWFQVVDAATGQIMPQTVPIQAPACQRAAAFVLSRTGKHMLIGCDNELHMLNTETQQWETNLVVAGALPGGFVASPDGQVVYVTTYDPTTKITSVVQVRVGERTVTPVPALGQESVADGQGGNLFLTGNGSKLVVYRFRQDVTTKAATSEVCVYDTRTWQQERCAQGGAGLFRPQLSAYGNRLYGALMKPDGILDTLATLDIATAQVQATYQLTDGIAGRVRVGP